MHSDAHHEDFVQPSNPHQSSSSAQCVSKSANVLYLIYPSDSVWNNLREISIRKRPLKMFLNCLCGLSLPELWLSYHFAKVFWEQWKPPHFPVGGESFSCACFQLTNRKDHVQGTVHSCSWSFTVLAYAKGAGKSLLLVPIANPCGPCGEKRTVNGSKIIGHRHSSSLQSSTGITK